jgi:hypothetical protein
MFNTVAAEEGRESVGQDGDLMIRMFQGKAQGYGVRDAISEVMFDSIQQSNAR